jgi:hypothetical protein
MSTDPFENVDPQSVVDAAKRLGHAVTLAAAAIAYVTDTDDRTAEFATFLSGVTGTKYDPEMLGVGLLTAGIDLTQFGDLIDRRKAEAESKLAGVKLT